MTYSRVREKSLILFSHCHYHFLCISLYHFLCNSASLPVNLCHFLPSSPVISLLLCSLPFTSLCNFISTLFFALPLSSSQWPLTNNSLLSSFICTLQWPTTSIFFHYPLCLDLVEYWQTKMRGQNH